MVVLVIGGILFYFVLNRMLDNQLTEELYLEKTTFISAYSNRNIPDSMELLPDLTVTQVDTYRKEKLIDTIVYNSLEKENEPSRMLRFCVNNGGNIFQVSMSKTLYEKEDLILNITKVLFGIIVFQFLLLYLWGRFVNKKLFEPFFSTLEKMRIYSSVSAKQLELESSPILEFRQLNESFTELHQRLRAEYIALKEFTENASHEMQTPLAVLRSKIEIMQMSEELSADMQNILSGMNEQISKLSRLNKSLMLMAKIENDQFEQTERIPLDALIQKKLDAFQELIELRKIQLSLVINEPIVIDMNSDLLDILLNNLISNAVKYCPQEGKINIHLQTGMLRISNSALKGALLQNKIFTRFYKEQSTSDSTGLGLAIIKQICDTCGFQIDYQFVDKEHQFTIDFSKEPK